MRLVRRKGRIEDDVRRNRDAIFAWAGIGLGDWRDYSMMDPTALIALVLAVVLALAALLSGGG